MSIAMPPVSAAQPDARPPATASEGQTLTLQLRIVPGAMAGRLAIRGAGGTADAMRVRVAMPPHAGWVFTA